MKKLTALISALALLLFLCACSGPGGAGTESEGVSPGPAASQAVSGAPVRETEPDEEPSAVLSGTPESSEAPSTVSDEPTQSPSSDDPKEIAISLIGRPVSELYDAIGEPLSSDYAPGCVEPGSEDGELIYSGFTVYTVRTSTREYVYDVL